MRFLKQIILNVSVIVLGSVIDYGAHQTSPLFSVPPRYMPNKIIFGSVIAIAAFLLGRRFVRTPDRLAAFVSAVTAVLLQVRYFFEGYNLFFVFTFLVLHFLMFLLLARLLFRRYAHLI